MSKERLNPNEQENIQGYSLEYDSDTHAMYIKFGIRIPGYGYRYSLSTRVDFTNTCAGWYDEYDTPEDIYGVSLKNLSKGTHLEQLRLPEEYRSIIESEVTKRGYLVYKNHPENDLPIHLQPMYYIPDDLSQEELSRIKQTIHDPDPNKFHIPIFAVNDSLYMFEEPRLVKRKRLF